MKHTTKLLLAALTCAFAPQTTQASLEEAVADATKPPLNICNNYYLPLTVNVTTEDGITTPFEIPAKIKGERTIEHEFNDFKTEGQRYAIVSVFLGDEFKFEGRIDTSGRISVADRTNSSVEHSIKNDYRISMTDATKGGTVVPSFIAKKACEILGDQSLLEYRIDEVRAVWNALTPAHQQSLKKPFEERTDEDRLAFPHPENMPSCLHFDPRDYLSFLSDEMYLLRDAQIKSLLTMLGWPDADAIHAAEHKLVAEGVGIHAHEPFEG